MPFSVRLKQTKNINSCYPFSQQIFVNCIQNTTHHVCIGNTAENKTVVRGFYTVVGGDKQ